MTTSNSLALYGLALIAMGSALAQAQRQPPTPAQSINRAFADVNRRVLDMAKDFPEDKYDFAPVKGVRTFGEVIIHIASGNVYAAKMARSFDSNIKWDELDPKQYKNKAAIVEALQKSIE